MGFATNHSKVVVPARSSGSRNVSVEERQRYFRDAIERLPPKTPVSVVLFPMEGDLPAPAMFWKVTRASKGVLMMPSADWP